MPLKQSFLALIFVFLTVSSATIPEEKLRVIQKKLTELSHLTKETGVHHQAPKRKTLAEKVFYVPVKSPPLKSFLIDMAVELSYLRDNIKGLISSKVNAELAEDSVLSRAMPNDVGHYEYTSPTFQLGVNSLPVGLQLFVPVNRLPETQQEVEQDLEDD